MYAEIVPYTRTPRGKDVFDYEVPAELDIEVGSLVWVNFRSSTVLGLVAGLNSETTAKRVKQIDDVLPYSWPAGKVEWLRWFCEYYAISLPTGFKAVQLPVVQTPKSVHVKVQTHKSKLKLSKSSVEAIQKTAEEYIALQNQQPVHVQYNYRDECLALYALLLRKVKGSTLIVCAEADQVQEVAGALSGSNAVIIDDRLSPSHISALLSKIAVEDVVVIGTKRTLFFPWDVFAQVIIDSEEQKAHKQFDANPRYHVRATSLKQFECLDNPPRLLYTSAVPSIEMDLAIARKEVKELRMETAWSNDHITLVDMNAEQHKERAWFSYEVLKAIEGSKKALVFLNRTGKYSIATCEDCGQILEVEAVQCDSCGGTQIRMQRKGIETLEEELQEAFPTKRIARIDGTVALPDIQRAKESDLVIATEKIFRVTEVGGFDAVCILSVDHLLVYPHFRAHERVLQLLNQLFHMRANVLLQSYSIEHPVIQAAYTHDFAAWQKKEMQMRKMFSYPPYGERVHVINTETKDVRLENQMPEQLKTTEVIDRE